jgi:hypothetical protein
LFEATAWPRASSEIANRMAPARKLDLGARMRGMWR